MSVKLRGRYPALAALVLAAAVVPATAFASAQVSDPLPIGPNLPFVGLVDGVDNNAVIKMVCPGPISPAETGHPLGGQTLEVSTLLPASVAAPGNTGSAATQIDADFNTVSAAGANPPVVFNSFFVQEPIPITDVFPCSGSGAVTFVPLPTSATARSFTVGVTFGNIAD
jgi:hypothetical protein